MPSNESHTLWGRTESLLCPKTQMHVFASSSFHSEDVLITDLFQGSSPLHPQVSSIMVAPRVYTLVVVWNKTPTHMCTNIHVHMHRVQTKERKTHRQGMSSPGMHSGHLPCPAPGILPLALEPGRLWAMRRRGPAFVMPRVGDDPTSAPATLPLVGREGRGCPQPTCNHISCGLGSFWVLSAQIKWEQNPQTTLTCEFCVWLGAQLCPTLWTVAHQAPLSMGIRRFWYPGNQTHIFCVSCIAGRFFTRWAMVQRLRICLPMQGTRVRSRNLVQELRSHVPQSN